MPLRIQRASAGSGKTEQLARHYLQILLTHDNEKYTTDPSTILATTFTREAAGEILARVFRIIARACKEEITRAHLVEGTQLPPPTASVCYTLLRRLVERVHLLNIGTIDALFAQQARALAPDLGLAPHWEIADTIATAELARKTALQLLEKNPLLRKEWNLLHRFARRLSFVEDAATLLEKYRFLARAEPLDKIFSESSPPKLLSKEKAAEVLHFLETFDLPLTGKGKPSKNWVQATAKLQDAFSRPLAIKDILGLSVLMMNSAHFIQSAPPQEVGSERSQFSGIAIPVDFLAVFSPLAEASRKEQQRLEALREEAFHHLVKQYDILRNGISFQSGSYTYSEIEEAVLNTPENFPREEIEFRMETRTEHLLLDEYQDTSQRQHDFLSPLVGNVLAKGGEVFVVGDVKQGIYGWRGGKRHLLSLLDQEHAPHGKKIAPLNHSYRSSRAVLAAVNEVFGALKNPETVEAMNAGEEFQQAARRWSHDFQPHEGAERVKNLPGRVLLHEIEVEGKEREERMHILVKRVIELVVTHRKEDLHREVAVLVRRTKFIPQILQGLRNQEILASGEGGNPLADTLAVETLLSLLSWIDHPGHSAAYIHVQHSPLQNLLEGKDPGNRLRSMLIDQGMATCLRKWSSLPAFQEACSDYERTRVEQLLEMADRFDTNGGGPPSEFVERARYERVESPLNSGVRVLSIHAAKGLEFQSVILMDLDLDLSLGRRDAVHIQSTEEGKFFIQTNQDLMALQGREGLLHKINEEQWAEALSLLYVGMTRAASYLDLVIFGPYGRRPSKTMAQWLRISGLQNHHEKGSVPDILEKGSVPEFNINPTFAIGDGDLSQYTRPQTSFQKPSCTKGTPRLLENNFETKSLQNIIHPNCESRVKKSEIGPFFTGRRRLSKRLPSGEQGGETIPLSQFLAPSNSSALERGSLIHALLAEILWSKELPKANDIIQKVTENLKTSFSSSEILQMTSTLLDQIHHGTVQPPSQQTIQLHRTIGAQSDHFIQSAPPQEVGSERLSSVFDPDYFLIKWQFLDVERLDVWRERRFAVILEDDTQRELLTGAFDRVVLGYNKNGKVIAAEIIDFKTDAVSPEQQQERAAHYRPQLDAYEQALRKLLPGIESVESTLVWVTL
ncbi:MAG TPA: UvrD-helicase domain-containing protein [Chthoniobacterales bacterium]|nr:UvrD-helicase domain-containing protein [Chthoniobacterales bacterium]